MNEKEKRLTDTAALMAGLKAKNPEALGLFWQMFWGRTYPICVRILGKGPYATDTAVDLLTDFAEQKVHDLKEPRAVYAYLRLAAVRRSLDVKKWRDKHTSLDFDIEESRDRTPESLAETTKLMPRLDRCLSLLTDKAGQCLRLKYTQELTDEDIGRLLGGSKQYIGRLIRQSLKELRACIEKGVKGVERPTEETMARDTLSSVTIHTVENLLSLRPRIDGAEHSAELFSLAGVISGVADERAAKEADEHLMRCAECRETSIVLHQLDAERDFCDEIKSPRPFPARSAVRGVMLAAAAMAILGLSILFLTKKAMPPVGDDTQLTVKGFEDDFIVAARRGALKFTVNPLDRLEEGDALGMFYSAARPGYLLVLSADESGRADVLYPSTKQESAEVSAGERISIADGAVAEQGQGCEWLIAIFSDAPIDAVAAGFAVENGERTTAQCGLKIAVAGARTIRILPVLR